MGSLRVLTGLSLALAGLACGGARPPVPSPVSEQKPEGAFHRGQLVHGHEVRSFTPCGDDAAMWVVDETPGRELAAASAQLGGESYQPIYVELVGRIGPPPADGFGTDYAGAIAVSELTRAVGEGRGCAEALDGFEFSASGNEPFWNVTIAESGIVFSQPAEPARVELPYNAPELLDDRRSYSTITEMPRFELQIVLRKQRCIDTMSGNWSDHEAVVRFAGRELHGCAYAGRPPSTGPPAYQLLSVEHRLPGCGEQGSESCTWFRFDYPVIVGGLDRPAVDALNSEIERWIRRPLREGRRPASPLDLIDRWVSDYEAFRTEFPDSSQRWLVRRTASVLAARPASLSLRMSEMWDTGGAHPNERVTYASFEAQAGQPLALAEILEPGAIAEFTAAAEAVFRRSKGIEATADLADSGYRFEGNRFALNDNFAITGSGVLFHFNPYEIAPYVAGPTSLELPFHEIEDLLRSPYRP